MATIPLHRSFDKEKGLRLLFTVALGLGLTLALWWILAAGALSPAWPGSPVSVASATWSEARRLVGAAGGAAGEPLSSPASRPMAAPSPPGSTEADGAARRRVNRALSNLPLRFVPNEGQTDPAVQFTVKGAGHTIFFTPEEVIFSALEQAADDEGQMTDGATHSAQRETRHSLVRLRFAGANPRPTIEGLAQMGGVVNYMLGNDPARWRFNVPTYEALAYRDLYPGVDLVYRGTEGHLKSEFVLAPGADLAAIVMVYDGVRGLHLGEDGALVLV